MTCGYRRPAGVGIGRLDFWGNLCTRSDMLLMRALVLTFNGYGVESMMTDKLQTLNRAARDLCQRAAEKPGFA